MNVSGPYSANPLYSLFQAGGGNSASSQTGTQSSSQSSGLSGQPTNNQSDPQSGSAGDAQDAVNALQAGLGNGAAAAPSTAQSPTPLIYTNPGSGGSSDTDPDSSYINNQQANADYQSMVLNLGQGNLAAAAKDYAQLQTDLKLHGLHGSGASVSADTNTGADSTAGSVFSVTV